MAAPARSTPARNIRSARAFGRADSARTARLPPHRLPLGREDRPHDVIAEHVPVAEAAAQHAFPGRTEPLEGAVAARVHVDRSRFKTMHAEIRENRVEEEARDAREEAGPPERAAENESPFGGGVV